MPYKIMVPKRGTGANLLVPVALSASAVAYSSTRIESMFMAVGSAAGVAAAQLADGSVATVQDVNVTRVQNILSAKFSQQIHGPPHAPSPSPPPPPPKNVPKYYIVGGAGDSACNGNYTLANSFGYSSPVTYTSEKNHLYQIYHERKSSHAGAGWRLAIKGRKVFYLAASETALPPETGWKAITGKDPAPTLVAGPVGANGL